MEHICEICGRKFKSASGLSGHKQLSHSLVAKPDTPDDHVLAEALESTIDLMGEHKAILEDLQANMLSVAGRLDGFQRSLTPPDGHNSPSLALISAWEECSACAPKWNELKEVLWQRFHEEKKAEAKVLAAHEDQVSERSEEVEVPNSYREAVDEHSEEAVAENSGQVEEAQPKRFLVVAGGYKKGFTWHDKQDNCPGLPADKKIEGYVRVCEDPDEVEVFRGKKDIEVIELDGLALDG